MEELGVAGRNSTGGLGYVGPCPPSGTHRYFFRLYALDDRPELGAGDTKDRLVAAMRWHVLADGRLMGTYSR